jgi:hypothetical protein
VASASFPDRRSEHDKVMISWIGQWFG